MNHSEFSEQLSAYLDGELPEERRIALEQHLAVCQQCMSEMESLRRVSGMLKEWDGPQLSMMGIARLHRAVDAESFGRLRRWALSLSSLAATLALATMLWAYQSRGLAAPAAWERIAITPGAQRADDSGGGTTEEVATAQWVVTDLGLGGADE
jgi:anti-sigma factor RsiW